MFMSTVEIRSEIDSYLDQLDDKFLKAVLAMLKTYSEEQEAEDPIVGYTIDGRPKRASVMREQLRKEVEGAEQGEYITLDELRKKSEQWLNRTK